MNNEFKNAIRKLRYAITRTKNELSFEKRDKQIQNYLQSLINEYEQAIKVLENYNDFDKHNKPRIYDLTTGKEVK